MKRTLLLLAALLFNGAILHAGDTAGLTWKSMDQGLAEAKRTHKNIMVDVYTTWCKWCKKLDEDVYGNKEVAAYLSKQFVLVKLNGEGTATLTYKGETKSEQQFAGTLGVTGYPTIVFFDQQGEPINSIPGYVPAEKFLPIIHYIGGNYYKSMGWDEYQMKHVKKQAGTN